MPARLSVALVVAAGILQAANVVYRPSLQAVAADRATILWATRENLSGAVFWSADGSYSSLTPAQVRAFAPAETGLPYTFYQYRVELRDLRPATEYAYRVAVGGEVISSDARSRFSTPAPGPFSFLVFGDSGAGTAGQTALALRMAEERPDLVLHVGDIAYELGTFDQFQAYYFEFYWTLMARVPFFATPGNHEYYTAGARPYLALTASPADGVPPPDQGRYYSFDWSDAHFVSLDSNLLADPVATERMLGWLEADLRATTARWRIAFFHHLPFPISHHIDDPLCAATRERFVPVLEKYGVQVVFNGHEHLYERTKPMRAGRVSASGPATLYITSGGGGGGLHPAVPQEWLARADSVYEYLRVQVANSAMTIRAIGIDGKEFDRVTLAVPSLAPRDALVNAASLGPAVAPGSLVSIFGEGLASEVGQALSGPLPTELAGSSATLNDVPLPLIYVSPTQINAQLPPNILGPAILRVATRSGSTSAAAEVVETAPAIFPSGVLHANGSLVTATSAAQPGEVLVLYMTGLGRVAGGPPAGQPAPPSPLLRVIAPVEVRFTEVAATPSFAGLAPGLVGVYQVQVEVPAALADSTYALRVLTGGTVSNTVNVPIRHR